MKFDFMDLRPLKLLCVLAVLMIGIPVGLVAGSARIALVVGNAAYDGDAMLKNPVNDATDIAAGLEKIGWKVIKVTDVNRRNFNRAIGGFADQLRANPGADALFYYAGHGMQIKNTNYLIPVQVDLETLEDVESEAINVSQISDVMEENRVDVALIILDACRDNPYAKKLTRSLGGTRGLSSSVSNKAGAKGSAVMYSTGPGDVAQDGKGRNGLFTSSLLKFMGPEYGELKLEDLFKKVSAEVREASRGAQQPWMNSSVVTDFYFVPENMRQPAAPAAVQVPAATPAPELPVHRGKAKFQSLIEGEVFLGDELIGVVGPDAELVAESLATGKNEFTFKVDGNVQESKTITVTDKAYAMVTFGKKSAAGSDTAQAPAVEAKADANGSFFGDQTDLGDSSVVAMAREKFKGKYILRVEGPVAGMKVFLNGASIGLTPLNVEIPTEDASIEVVHDDYEPWKKELHPAKGEEIVLNVNTGRSLSYKRRSALDEYASLQQVLKQAKAGQAFPQTMAGVGWLTFLGGAGISAYAFIQGSSLRSQYDYASDVTSILNLRYQMEEMDNFFKAGIITGASGLLGALLFEILVPSTVQAERNVQTAYQNVVDLGGF